MSKSFLQKLEGERDGFRSYDDAIIKRLAMLYQKDPIEYARSKQKVAERLGISTYDVEKLVSSKQQEALQQDNRGFKLVRSCDLKVKAPDWLVHGMIEDDTLGLMFGDSESGKTFLAIDLALSVATGKSFHDKTVKQGPVVYIIGEGKNGFSRRCMAWSINKAIDYQDAPFFVSTIPAAFLNPDSTAQVAAAIADVKPVLIVVDTLARNYGPGDENSTSDMNKFISALDYIRRPHKATMLVIHHTGHGQKDRGRGAYALKCALDFEFRVKCEPDGIIILESTKMKDAEKPEPLAFAPQVMKIINDDKQRMTSLALELIKDYGPTKGIRRSLTGARKIAYDVLLITCQENDGKVHIDIWRDAAYKAGISASTEQAAKQKAFVRAVSSLHDIGLIETDDDFYWIKPDNQT